MAIDKAPALNIASIFKDALDREHIGVEKAAEALGVSKQAVSRYQNGIDSPGQDKVACWLQSETLWVRIMALQIFDAMYPGIMRGILTPTRKNPRVDNPCDP